MEIKKQKVNLAWLPDKGLLTVELDKHMEFSGTDKNQFHDHTIYTICLKKDQNMQAAKERKNIPPQFSQPR